MSFVRVVPEAFTVAAADLPGIGAAIGAANAAVASSTTEVVAAGVDEVSGAVAALFSGQAHQGENGARGQDG